mmetsp:Transcript_38497/g.95602  ORF Transcript_38497/g.95602 Transcript_38497/m.95602 type:complete len:206 (+) Transcript_38497:999-1616(+)
MVQRIRPRDQGKECALVLPRVVVVGVPRCATECRECVVVAAVVAVVGVVDAVGAVLCVQILDETVLLCIVAHLEPVVALIPVPVLTHLRFLASGQVERAAGDDRLRPQHVVQARPRQLVVRVLPAKCTDDGVSIFRALLQQPVQHVQGRASLEVCRAPILVPKERIPVAHLLHLGQHVDPRPPPAAPRIADRAEAEVYVPLVQQL